MSKEPEPPLALLAGRRALDDVSGFTLLSDWTWNQLVGKWVLLCRLSINAPDTSPLPSNTEWFILVDPSYPWGKIKFYPAKDGGIDKTFQHQSYNSFGEENVPWRTGDICVDTRIQVLGRHAANVEPFDVHQRLRWRVCRAIAWLEAASQNKLVLQGEPFEVPWFPTCLKAPVKVAFGEDESTFAKWKEIDHKFGTTDLITTGFNHIVVMQFCSPDGKVLLESQWGNSIPKPNKNKNAIKGIWIRLDTLPVLPPWQIPTTWGDFQPILQKNRVTFDELPRKLTSAFRDGERHVALIGYPIPRNLGESPCRMQWAAIWLPHLSYGKQKLDGFRPNEMGYRQRDKGKVFYDNAKIDWLDTDNWSSEQITSRGKLPNTLTKQSICILGVGALGSVISEMLVRAGVEDLVIIDNDIVEIGNLVRHTTLLTDLNQFKAQAIAQRLRVSSPHVKVTVIANSFQKLSSSEIECVRQCGVIIDCTADDAVLYQLRQFDWQGPHLFISLSLGFQARRLYCYSCYSTAFSDDSFHDLIGQWLIKEREEIGDFEFPQEGIGCWHPVFPARIDDVWMFASVALKCVEEAARTEPSIPELRVFEQEFRDGSYCGIRECHDEGRNG